MNDAQETMKEFQAKMRAEYGPMYFDRQGNELQLMDWGDKCEDMNYKVVKQDQVGKYFVSTVWVGLNMRLFRGAPPLIFETMVLMDEADQEDEFYFYQKRYSTEQEALMGHEEVLSLVKNRIASVTPPPGTVTTLKE